MIKTAIVIHAACVLASSTVCYLLLGVGPAIACALSGSFMSGLQILLMVTR